MQRCKCKSHVLISTPACPISLPPPNTILTHNGPKGISRRLSRVVLIAFNLPGRTQISRPAYPQGFPGKPWPLACPLPARLTLPVAPQSPPVAPLALAPPWPRLPRLHWLHGCPAPLPHPQAPVPTNPPPHNLVRYRVCRQSLGLMAEVVQA